MIFKIFFKVFFNGVYLQSFRGEKSNSEKENYFETGHISTIQANSNLCEMHSLNFEVYFVHLNSPFSGMLGHNPGKINCLCNGQKRYEFLFYIFMNQNYFGKTSLFDIFAKNAEWIYLRFYTYSVRERGGHLCFLCLERRE